MAGHRGERESVCVCGHRKEAWRARGCAETHLHRSWRWCVCDCCPLGSLPGQDRVWVESRSVYSRSCQGRWPPEWHLGFAADISDSLAAPWAVSPAAPVMCPLSPGFTFVARASVVIKRPLVCVLGGAQALPGQEGRGCGIYSCDRRVRCGAWTGNQWALRGCSYLIDFFVFVFLNCGKIRTPKFTILSVSEFFMVQFRGMSHIHLVCHHPRRPSPGPSHLSRLELCTP